MKYINFKKLSLKNFLSIGDTPVIVEFSEGLHIITGVNRDKEDRRNGVGKSTIADGLFFAVFGNTLRDIKKEYICNNITQKTCEVQLEFEVISDNKIDEYCIIRSLSPSRLMLFKNKNEITRDSIANTNTHIEYIMSSSQDIFKNCVIMTLNDTIPFMSRSKADKRKFIEKIFNLEIFSEMSKNLRNSFNSTKRELDIENTKSAEVNSNISAFKREKEGKEKEKDKKVAELKREIIKNTSELTRVQMQLNNLAYIDSNEKKKELDKYSKGLIKAGKKYTEYVAEIAQLKITIKNENDFLSKIGTGESVCPTCLKPVSEHDQRHIEEEKSTVTKRIKEYNSTLTELTSKKSEISDKKDKISNHIDKLNEDLKKAAVYDTTKSALEKRVEDINKLNEELENRIDTITVDATIFDKLINEAEEKLTTVADQINSIKKSLDLLDVVKFVISEEGVKSFLIKKILNTFNSKLAYYLKKLDSNSICIFNEYFEEEILNEKGKMCSYNNFSGAERKAIDLACLFSFMDMRKHQGDVHFNVSIYDELFDSSLDQRGVELVVEILKERVRIHNESVFIISHRKESIKAIDGEVIFLEKINGITNRTNYVD